ncbi:MAG: hypothetical protein ACLR23_08115 [Clostridia bacterium]
MTEDNGTYYVTDMPKLLEYINEGKKWSDIGLDSIYGNINIASTDPVTSSPGATYYGLFGIDYERRRNHPGQFVADDAQTFQFLH